MAEVILTDAITAVEEFDLSGHSNEVGIDRQRVIRDATQFGDSVVNFRAGLPSGVFSMAGLFDSAADAQVGVDQLATTLRHVTIIPAGASTGGVGWSMPGTFEYNLAGRVNDLFRWTARLDQGEDTTLYAPGSIAIPSQRTRGTVLYNERTTTGPDSGDAIQLGAITASETLYCLVHATEFEGSGSQGVTAILQSDDNASFTSPTLRASLGAAASSGPFFTIFAVAGAVTDDYWRLQLDLNSLAWDALTIRALAVIQ